MIPRSLLLVASLTLCACLVDADLSGAGYRCESVDQCAPGLVCEAGRCAPVSADAGIADAGEGQAPNEVVRLRHPTEYSELLTIDPARVQDALDAGFVSDGVVFTASPTPSDALVPIYELRHDSKLDILFTNSRDERDSAVTRYGYTAVGIAFFAAPPSAPDLTPVHRLQRLSMHRYAVGDSERDALLNAGWNYEHVLFRAETR